MQKVIDKKVAEKKVSLTAKIKRNSSMYLLLIPAVVAVIVFGYLPLLGIAIAFKDYDVLVGFAKSPWVGFENFKMIFTTPSFLTAIKHTLCYSTFNLFAKLPFPVILAVLINELSSKRFKKTVQTITYLPHFLSWATVIGFAYSMFALRGGYNDIMAAIFGESYERVNILMDSKYFWGVLFFSGLWKEVGWSSIIYLAAITSIDPSLYEAARVDGANRFQQILKITIPAICPTVVIILIMNIGSIVTNNFEQVYGFQNVYTQDKTEVIGTLTYRMGIQAGRYSEATAFGLTQGLVSFTLVAITNKISKKISNIAIW